MDWLPFKAGTTCSKYWTENHDQVIQRYFVLEIWNDARVHFGAHLLWEEFVRAVLWEMSVHLFLCLDFCVSAIC